MKNENQDLALVFLREKPVNLLIQINRQKKPYAATLAKKIDCTYAHTVKLLGKLQENGIITFRKEGRVKYVKLSESGTGLAEKVESLLSDLQE